MIGEITPPEGSFGPNPKFVTLGSVIDGLWQSIGFVRTPAAKTPTEPSAQPQPEQVQPAQPDQPVQ